MKAVWSLEVVWEEMLDIFKECGSLEIGDLFGLMEERGVQAWQIVQGLLWAIKAGFLEEGDGFVCMKEKK